MAQVIKRYGTVTTTGAKEAVAMPSAVHKYGVQLKAVGGTLTSWTLTLEGSLDGVNFSTLITHNANDGSTLWTSEKPCLFYRVNLSALSLGTATSVDITAVGTT